MHESILILPQLISLQLPSLPAAHEYLGHLFEYHTKTRTMNELALAILRSFGSPIRVATKNDSRHLYDLASSGPLQTQGLLARLSTVVNGFLTPGQVVDLAESVMAYIKISLTDFHESAAQLSASNGQGSRKKQKRGAQGEQPSSGDPEFLAVAISGSAKVATAILTSLPLRILPDDTRGKLLETIQEFYNLVVVGSVKKTLRKLDSDDQLNTWGWQIVLSSLLRLRYYMLSAPQLGILLEVEAKFVPRLVAAVKLDDVLPELQIEIVSFPL